MKRLLVALLLLTMCVAPQVSTAADWSGAKWLPGRLIVEFDRSVGEVLDDQAAATGVAFGVPSVDALVSRYEVTAARRLVDDALLSKLTLVPDFFRVVILECPESTDILRMAADFEKDPHVVSVEPDLLRPVSDHLPSDAMWGSQWDKRIMNCPKAWEFGTGSRDILMIAVDGGSWWMHPDYYDNLWVNPGEDIDQDGVAYTGDNYPGDPDDVNGVDDDDNGKIDDLIGWDFIRNISNCETGEDCDSQEDNNPISIDDHGTHTLGLMGAVGDNDIGVTGVNWHSRIIASRAGFRERNNPQGYIANSAAVQTILWSVGVGADIVNMSYGSSQGSSQERNAIAAAWNNGAILCGASGNAGVTTPHYPAAHPNVVAVGSTDTDDGVSNFSNRGDWVDCYAPGNMVLSTIIGGYTSYPGTSMASPNAAGVFGLIWSIFPDMTNSEVVDFVLGHCEDITAENPSIPPSYLGHGRVDAMLPLASVYPYLSLEAFSQSGDTDQDGRLEGGETGNLVLTLHNDPAWQAGSNMQVTVTSSDTNLTMSNNTFALPSITPGQSIQFAENPVQVTASANVMDAYWTSIDAIVTGPNNYRQQFSFIIRVGRAATVVVADDGVDVYHNFYTAALVVAEPLGYNYDVWSVPVHGEPAYEDLDEYGYMIWVCGNDSVSALSAENQTLLAQFLDAGGKLFLTGQGIDEHIGGSDFYTNYVHCQSTGLGGSRNVIGVAGDPISDGANLLLLGGGGGGNGSVGPDQLTPLGTAVGMFSYQTGGFGAVRFENETYKVAFYAFGLEAAVGSGGTTHHRVVMQRTMEWLGAPQSPVSDADEPRENPAVTKGLALHPNYPNPFNPTTTLSFDLPKAAHVSLRVFDMLGREVAVLVNHPMSAGAHTLNFDGSNLASGSYIVHLLADGQGVTRRMLLLK